LRYTSSGSGTTPRMPRMQLFHRADHPPRGASVGRPLNLGVGGATPRKRILHTLWTDLADEWGMAQVQRAAREGSGTSSQPPLRAAGATTGQGYASRSNHNFRRRRVIIPHRRLAPPPERAVGRDTLSGGTGWETLARLGNAVRPGGLRCERRCFVLLRVGSGRGTYRRLGRTVRGTLLLRGEEVRSQQQQQQQRIRTKHHSW